MSYLQESLAPDEHIVAIFNLHWTAKGWLILWIVLTIPTIGIALIGVIYEYLRLRAIEQGVTNRRVVRKHGFISRETEELRLASIETIDLHQSGWGRLLGFGDIRITGRGESSMLIARIHDPLGAKRAIEGAYTTTENAPPAR